MSSGLYGKLEIDVDVKATAEQYYHMFKHRLHHIHNTTEIVQGVDLHQGEWGTVGSVITWNYVHDGKPRKHKDIIEEIDDEKKSITFKVIEGDLTEHYKDIKFILQVTPKSDGQGCVARWTVVYKKHHGEIVEPHTLLELVREFSMDIEAHLLQES